MCQAFDGEHAFMSPPPRAPKPAIPTYEQRGKGNDRTEPWPSLVSRMVGAWDAVSTADAEGLTDEGTLRRLWSEVDAVMDEARSRCGHG